MANVELQQAKLNELFAGFGMVALTSLLEKERLLAAAGLEPIRTRTP